MHTCGLHRPHRNPDEWWGSCFRNFFPIWTLAPAILSTNTTQGSKGIRQADDRPEFKL